MRVWCWPGNTSDQALIRQVKDDMRDWTLSKIVWVADRGFSSQANRRYLRQSAGGWTQLLQPPGAGPDDQRVDLHALLPVRVDQLHLHVLDVL